MKKFYLKSGTIIGSPFLRADSWAHIPAPVMFYGAGILAMVGCKKYESVEKAV